MKNYLKWGGGILIILLIIAAIGFKVAEYQTKQHSPEELVTFEKDDTQISVFYNRPYKKGRDIFGSLVPYGEVWRTGANEATTFSTNKDLIIDGKSLPAGEYTLWSIPESNSWTIIFNKKQYSWGVNRNNEASRDPEYDALQAKVLPEPLNNSVEQFTISFDEGPAPVMVLVWDKTKVAVPMQL